ncbi:ABC transporter permease [Aquipuribacter sp. SD81]|uniref:ABC transporter permease n=1 Tax=Aquipuribacter sp. SD81 TaxID=3127703 RepID=UPI00301757FE
MSAAPASAPQETSRLLDTGYRPYDGPRAGVAGAVASLVRYSVGRGLGVGRPLGGKVPIGLVLLVAYLPALALVGVAVIAGDVLQQTLVESVRDYYQLITTAVVAFAALVVPELFCTDKRTGMLGRYLATPLTRWTYLLAKAVALVVLLALVALGPPLLLLLGLAGTGDAVPPVAELLDVLWRILLATPLLALPVAAVGAAASSLTSRRVVATAVIAVLLLVGGAVSAVLVGTGSWPVVQLVDVVAVAFEAPARLLGADSALSTVPLWQVGAAWLAWVAVPTTVVVTSYATTKVSR